MQVSVASVDMVCVHIDAAYAKALANNVHNEDVAANSVHSHRGDAIERRIEQIAVDRARKNLAFQPITSLFVLQVLESCQFCEYVQLQPRRADRHLDWGRKSHVAAL